MVVEKITRHELQIQIRSQHEAILQIRNEIDRNRAVIGHLLKSVDLLKEIIKEHIAKEEKE